MSFTHLAFKRVGLGGDDFRPPLGWSDDHKDRPTDQYDALDSFGNGTVQSLLHHYRMKLKLVIRHPHQINEGSDATAGRTNGRRVIRIPGLGFSQRVIPETFLKCARFRPTTRYLSPWERMAAAMLLPMLRQPQSGRILLSCYFYWSLYCLSCELRIFSERCSYPLRIGLSFALTWAELKVPIY